MAVVPLHQKKYVKYKTILNKATAVFLKKPNGMNGNAAIMISNTLLQLKIVKEAFDAEFANKIIHIS